MVVDPVSLAVFSGIVGAASRKFVDDAWDLGKGWLDEYFSKHQPKAQEKAQENALDFLVELGNRIQELEKQAENDSVFRERIEKTLSDPDFSALLQDALISSARTSSKEKHNLLANVVSDRLLAEQESLKALATNMVVDVIPHLSPNQLKLLGLMTVILWGIRPKEPSKEADVNYWRGYLIETCSPLIPEDDVVPIDYMHLESVSCISQSMGFRKIDQFIEPPEELCADWNSDIFLKETDEGKRINKIWDDEMKHCYLTSIGGLIGTYVHDEVNGGKTDISEIYGVF